MAGEALIFEDLAVTEMACLEPTGIMGQEAIIMRTLWEAANFKAEGNHLQVLTSTGVALIYERLEDPYYGSAIEDYTAPKTRTAFCPPSPKLFDTATRTSLCRASLGT